MAKINITVSGRSCIVVESAKRSRKPENSFQNRHGERKTNKGNLKQPQSRSYDYVITNVAGQPYTVKQGQKSRLTWEDLEDIAVRGANIQFVRMSHSQIDYIMGGIYDIRSRMREQQSEGIS